VEDRSATAPIDEAEAWLSEHQSDDRPRLAFIHLRGGHPPFDIDRDTARTLPPAEYGGDLDARRAAIQLSEIRQRPRVRQRMPEEDWTRLFALQKAALLRQDQRISEFLAWLSQTGLDQDTLLVVMGDVAAGDRPKIPFSLRASVREETTQTLLVVGHPDGRRAGTTSRLALSTVDVSRTIAGYLGIDLPGAWPRAIDFGEESMRGQAEMREQIAYRAGEYATSLGPYLLRGEDGKRPSLCLLSLDPGCLEDRSSSQPIATRTLWTSTWLELSSRLTALPEPIKRDVDPELEAALTVWGVPR
jgi:arylsulfatase A-like enzyme